MSSYIKSYFTNTSPLLVEDSNLPLAYSFLNYIPSKFHPYLRSLLIQALRLGPRPKHVAFIMDGNRRFARNKGEPVRVGHEVNKT